MSTKVRYQQDHSKKSELSSYYHSRRQAKRKAHIKNLLTHPIKSSHGEYRVDWGRVDKNRTVGVLEIDNRGQGITVGLATVTDSGRSARPEDSCLFERGKRA